MKKYKCLCCGCYNLTLEELEKEGWCKTCKKQKWDQKDKNEKNN